jgi:hypothetical protein
MHRGFHVVELSRLLLKVFAACTNPLTEGLTAENA